MSDTRHPAIFPFDVSRRENSRPPVSQRRARRTTREQRARERNFGKSDRRFRSEESLTDSARDDAPMRPPRCDTLPRSDSSASQRIIISAASRARMLRGKCETVEMNTAESATSPPPPPVLVLRARLYRVYDKLSRTRYTMTCLIYFARTQERVAFPARGYIVTCSVYQIALQNTAVKESISETRLSPANEI